MKKESRREFFARLSTPFKVVIEDQREWIDVGRVFEFTPSTEKIVSYENKQIFIKSTPFGVCAFDQLKNYMVLKVSETNKLMCSPTQFWEKGMGISHMSFSKCEVEV